jgi:hypothetical protein
MRLSYHALGDRFHGRPERQSAQLKPLTPHADNTIGSGGILSGIAQCSGMIGAMVNLWR